MTAAGDHVQSKKPKEIRECIAQIQISKLPSKDIDNCQNPAINSIRIEIEEIRKRNYEFIAAFLNYIQSYIWHYASRFGPAR
jgi:hypothetical protein